MLVPPHTFMVMNIEQQIRQVLNSMNPNDLKLSSSRGSDFSPSLMTDIQHGRVYMNILRTLNNQRESKFITLTCNVDGVALYSHSEQHMWTFTACINEIKRTLRFSIENIIGHKKPSRIIMQKMLSSIVLRLNELQKPNFYQISNFSQEMLRLYLIGVCDDKPANSLVQNQPEPNALYGCSKCEIAGITTPCKVLSSSILSNKKKITYVRIFPTPTHQQIELRSNFRWMEISHALQNKHSFLTEDNQMHSFGYLGECELTNLAYIDRGTSFMSDTLHSIYHGAFKRLLQLWTKSSKKDPWSIVGFLPEIHADLGHIRYPSTTTRAPRSILKCSNLKANESRVLLLICYPVFKSYLPEKYYKHLQMLAFGITIGESSNISSKNINDMQMLLSSFVDNFPYPERYVVQNIHCVKHFVTTVEDFGPLFNYSTFNYESTIGYLSASVHGTKRLATELMLNLQLFKQSYFASKHHCSTSLVSPFIQYLCDGKKYRPREKLSDEKITKDDFDLLFQAVPKNCLIKSMKFDSLIQNFTLL
ncbi:unnamed protein product [Rotaria sp. Silwood2]|nr:unnamed protein product [Rotaria sp. Silwood2]